MIMCKCPPSHGCISLSVRGGEDLGPKGAALQTVFNGFPFFAELWKVLEVGGLRAVCQGGWARPLFWIADSCVYLRQMEGQGFLFSLFIHKLDCFQLGC